MAYIGNSPQDNSRAKAARTVVSFTPSTNTVTFTPSGGYTAGYVDVYKNGERLLVGTDFQANNGTTVVLSANAVSGDTIEIVSHSPVAYDNIVKKSGDTMAGTLVVQDVLPDANLVYDLGSPDKRFKDLYLSGNSIHIGGITIRTEGANVNFGVTATGAQAQVSTRDLLAQDSVVITTSNTSDVGATTTTLTHSNVHIANSTVGTIVSANSINVGNSAGSIYAGPITANGTLQVQAGRLSVNNATGANNTISGNTTFSNAVVISSVGGLTTTGQATFGDSVTVQGNLIVSGNTTYLNTNELDVGDATITVNADLPANANPVDNAGLIVNRGIETNTSILFDETNDRWDVTGDLYTDDNVVFANTLGTGNTTVTGSLSVSETATVTGGLNVTGATSLANTLSAGNTTISGTLETTGGATIGGLAQLNGGANVSGTSTVSGLSTTGTLASGNAAITGTVTITGDSTITGNTDQTGDVSLTGDVAQTGNTTITGNETITGTLQVQGQTTANVVVATSVQTTASANIGSTLAVGGPTTVSNTLSAGNTTITGFANVVGTLNTTGDTTLSNTTISGPTTINNTLGSGNTSVTGSLTVSGATSLQNPVSVTHTLGAGNTTVTGFANVSSTLNVAGDTTLTNLAVGNTTLTGDLSVSANGTVSGHANVGSLNVVGQTTAKQINVGNTTITGYATISSTLGVTGNTSVNGTTTLKTTNTGNTTVTGYANVSSTLGVTGATSLANTLGVTGAVTLSDTLTVTEATTLSNNATVGGTLGVTRAATFSNTVTVTGATTLNNTLATGNTTVTGTLTTSANATFNGTDTTVNNLVANTQDVANFVDFTAITHPTHAEGRVFYDSEHKALAYYNDEADVTMEIGRESWLRVYNATGSTIPNGAAVYISGASGETPLVNIADASDDAKYNVIGLATHAIEDSTYGYVTRYGVVHDLDTSAFSAGDKVHLSANNPGGLTNSILSYPNHPMDIGTVVVSNSTVGSVLVDIIPHTSESEYVEGDHYVGGDLTVAGSFTVLGDQTVTAVNNLEVADQFIYLGSGDTVSNTSFSGSGLNDMLFKGHYEGTSTQTYYVRIDGTGANDTFEWSKDNFSTTEATGVAITGAEQSLENGFSVEFGAVTGHTSGDTWIGTGVPLNLDWAVVGNYANSTNYSHTGIFRDAGDNRIKFMGRYDPEISGDIDTAHASFEFADIQANRLYGAVTGNVTGDTSGTHTGAVVGNASTASKWQTPRTLSLAGDVSGSVSIDGSANVSITATVADDSHNHVTGNIDGLAEYISDTVGAMVGGNTESGINVTYDDNDNTLDFNVGDPTITLTGAVTGSGTITNLANVTITTTATSDPTLTLAGDASGSATFTNLGNATLTVTVADDSHTHDGRYYTESESDARFVNVTGDTMTGQLQVANDSGIYVKSSTNGAGAKINFSDQVSGYAQVGTIQYLHSDGAVTTTGGNSSDGFIISGTEARTVVKVEGDIIATGDIYEGSDRVWHAGNDGSGSGLDADLLDGVQGSSFLRSDTSDSYTGSNLSFGTSSKLSFGSGVRQMIDLYGTVYGIGVQSSTLYCRSDSRFSWFRDGVHSNTENTAGTGGTVAMTLDGSSNLTAAGNITAYSDINLKKDLEKIDNAVNKVKQISGYTYSRTDMDDDVRHAGVVAQEVEKVLPEVVMTDDDGIKSVAYGNMVGLLIEAIKEQQDQIDTLKAEIESLK